MISVDKVVPLYEGRISHKTFKETSERASRLKLQNLVFKKSEASWKDVLP